MIRALTQILLCALILGGGSFGAWTILKNKPEAERKDNVVQARVVRVKTVNPETITLRVRTHGVVQPRSELQVIAEVSGRIKDLADCMVSGGFFDAQEQLIQLDKADYQVAVKMAEVEVARANRQLALEEAEAETARAEWALEHPDEPPPALVARTPQIAEVKAALAAARATLTKAKLDRDRTTIRAPFEGRVRTELVDNGQFVSRGQVLATIYAIDFAEVRLPISDEDLQFVDLPLDLDSTDGSDGPSIEFSAQFAGQQAEWSGRIVRTEGEIDPRTRMIHAIARVKDPYNRKSKREGPPLAIGMFVRGEVIGRKLTDVYRLPRSILYDRNKVLVADHEDKIRIVELTILRRTTDDVIARGALFGQRLVLSRLDTYTDGMVVQPTSTNPDEPSPEPNQDSTEPNGSDGGN